MKKLPLGIFTLSAFMVAFSFTNFTNAAIIDQQKYSDTLSGVLQTSPNYGNTIQTLGTGLSGTLKYIALYLAGNTQSLNDIRLVECAHSGNASTTPDFVATGTCGTNTSQVYARWYPVNSNGTTKYSSYTLPTSDSKIYDFYDFRIAHNPASTVLGSATSTDGIILNPTSYYYLTFTFTPGTAQLAKTYGSASSASVGVCYRSAESLSFANWQTCSNISDMYYQLVSDLGQNNRSEIIGINAPLNQEATSTTFTVNFTYYALSTDPYTYLGLSYYDENDLINSQIAWNEAIQYDKVVTTSQNVTLTLGHTYILSPALMGTTTSLGASAQFSNQHVEITIGSNFIPATTLGYFSSSTNASSTLNTAYDRCNFGGGNFITQLIFDVFNGGCRLAIFLFIPDPKDVERFKNIPDYFTAKAPFSLISDGLKLINELTATTTASSSLTISFQATSTATTVTSVLPTFNPQSIVDQWPIISQVRTGISYILYGVYGLAMFVIITSIL